MKQIVIKLLSLVVVIGTLLAICSCNSAGDTTETNEPDGEYEFFSKLDKEATGLTVAFENGTASGDWSEAKEQLLKYYKEKFADIDYLENTYGNGTADTAALDTLIFADSERYLSKARVTTTLKQISIPLTNSQIQSSYILAVLKHDSESGVRMYSKESGEKYEPVLSITYSDGSTVDYKVAHDSYVRATGYGNKNKNATTAWGKENPNELWAMHTSDIENKMPYSDNEMRTYIKFDYTSNGKTVKRAAIKIYAEVKNPDGSTPDSSKAIPLMAFSPCFTNWTEDTLTWQTIADAKSFAFYSWDGLGGIIYDEELYGKEFSNLGLTSQFIQGTSRFQEEASLCQAGKYKEAKDMLLRFAEQTYDTLKNADATSGGYPFVHPIGSANRALVFPVVYKDLLDHNVLTAEENYQILRWFYQEINYIVYDKSETIFVNGTAVPNTETNFYKDNFGPWHMSAYYNCFAFFPEFEESSAWQQLFEEKLTLMANVLVHNDGSYTEVTFGYPSAVIGWYSGMMKYMSAQNYTSGAADTLKAAMSNIAKYMADCSYPNGYMPKYGDGGSVLLENITSKLRSVGAIGNEGIKPSLAAFYPDAKIAVSRTGTSSSADVLFMNAKGGGIHSHADSLAILLYAKGRELLADKGHLTYDSSNEGFDLNSRTYTHNTVEINETAQRHPGSAGATVAAGHDGEAQNIVQYANTASTTIRAYTTSNKDATHYRNVTWLKDFDLLLVNDYINSETGKDVSCTQNWHTLPDALPKVADNGILGYTNFKSGANLIIAQATPNGDGGNTIAGAIKTSPDSNSSSKTSEYFEFAQSGKNVTYNTAIAYYSGTAFGLRNSALNTGVKDYVASAMLVERFNDNDMKNYLDSVIYYNSFEEIPSERAVSSDNKTLFKTNAANAYFHKVEKVDALSISGGTTLTVYDSNGTTVIARLTASAKVTDLSVKYDAATGTVVISTTDVGVINGTVTVTVEFSEYDNVSGATLNGEALQNATVNANGVTFNKN